MTNNNEFSRIIELNDDILEKKLKINANDIELKALSKRFEVYSIKFLNAEYIITPKTDILGAYILTLSVHSEVTKFMIGEKEENILINDKFDIILLDESMARNNYEQLKDYDIEIFDNDMRVDIGEIAAQYLSLCVFM